MPRRNLLFRLIDYIVHLYGQVEVVNDRLIPILSLSKRLNILNIFFLPLHIAYVHWLLRMNHWLPHIMLVLSSSHNFFSYLWNQTPDLNYYPACFNFLHVHFPSLLPWGSLLRVLSVCALTFLFATLQKPPTQF